MTHYIDKDAVLARIDELLNIREHTSHLDEEAFNSGRWKGLKIAKGVINTLEVKEVDLERETKDWWDLHLHLNPDNQLWMDAHQSLTFAKHFFELGLKASNPLTWEDIAQINSITNTLLNECKDEILYDTEEEFSKEVLKRFKAQKGEKV